MANKFDPILGEYRQSDAVDAPASTVPYMHLTLTTAQNHGGVDGSVTYVEWDGTEINKDTGFTHSTVTNPSRIEVDEDGTYALTFMVGAEQGGGSRTTLKSRYRINGSTVVERGAQRNYSRGSGYGDISVGMVTELALSSGDYIEVGTEVEDTDGIYTINSIPSECEVIIRRVDELGGAKGDTGADSTVAGPTGEGVVVGGTTGQVLAKVSATDFDTEWVDQSGGGGAVDSVNSQTGAVVLDADDIDDTSTTNKFVTAGDITKLSNLSGTNTGDQDISGIATNATDIDDLETSQASQDIAIGLNTAKVSYTDSAKVAGIANGATANDTDANLKSRANHTGTQPASTISDFDTEVSNNASVTANTAKVGVTDETNDDTVDAHIADTTNPHSVTKTQVGLGNVDNTSDANKPVSTATQTEIDTKQDTLVSATNIKTINSTSLLGSGDIVISGGGGAVDSVNTQTGAVVLDADDIDDTSTTNKFATASQLSKADSATQPADIADFETTTELNARDTANRSRANHTGTQAVGTITGLATVATTGAYSDITGTPTIPIISDTAYNATSWNTNTDGASKNAIRDKVETMDTAIGLNTAKVSYPSGDATKVGHISVTQAVNLDTMESDIATNNAKTGITAGQASDITANNAKVSNATHTGDATGSTALTLATVNSNVGSFTNADVTVNAKGLITAVANGSSGGTVDVLSNVATDRIIGRTTAG